MTYRQTKTRKKKKKPTDTLGDTNTQTQNQKVPRVEKSPNHEQNSHSILHRNASSNPILRFVQLEYAAQSELFFLQILHQGLYRAMGLGGGGVDWL